MYFVMLMTDFDVFVTNKMSPAFLLVTILSRQPIKALFGLDYAEDYPEIIQFGGLKRAIVRRRIRLLKMRLKFCTGQTCQKCAKVLAKKYDTPKKVF